MYHYLLRELSNEWVAKHKERAFNRRQVISGEMKEWDVVATAVRNNPLYQNWIYRTHSGIFVWADCTTDNVDITIDTLGAFGVPDWSDETFSQYTTVAIMYPFLVYQ